MKTNKYLFLMLLIALCSMNVTAQQRNILQVPDVTTQIGNAQLPVSIENTDEIVGVQFDLTLPEGVTAEQVGIMANRGDGHSVTVSLLSSGAYRVMLHSTQNRPLRGQSGVVMYLPITIPASFKEGYEYPLAITNAVLGKASGDNVLTEAMAGKIRISKLPDLTVKNITCDKQTLNPGDRIACSWQVENIGEIATGGGWGEQVLLISGDGTLSKLIATTHYDDILDASGIVSRQTEITLPTLLGMDGQVRLQVRIVPDSNTGESKSAQGNNIQAGTNLLHINKVLTLEMSPNRVDENSGRRIALRMNRSGRWTVDETFTMTTTADSRLSVPSSITIPAGQSGTVVYLTVTDNDVVDDTSDVTMSVEGNDYPAAVAHLTIDDNELPDLRVTASKSVVNEGETFQLTITASRVVTTSIEVTLTSENDKRFTYPRKVTIPAGQNSVTVNVMVKDDDIPSEALSVAFTASTPRYNQGETFVLLEDDDMPVLQLTLTPNKIVEGAGPVSVTGTLRRTGVTTNKITVRLSDDSNGALYFGTRELVLNKGVEEVNFNFGPIDNAQVDGDRTYTVTAAVWLSSCSCSAAGESAGSVSATLAVFDDDGPALTLTSSLSTIKEGSKAMFTVGRNTLASLDHPLTVHLSSDYDDNLSYEHTVTIPAGEQNVQVEITSKKNDVSGDTHTAVFTAQAEGFASATCWLMVTDQTLPDAVITRISSFVSEVTAGTNMLLALNIANQGFTNLPEGTEIIVRAGDISKNITLHCQLEPDGQTIQETSLPVPEKVGEFTCSAIINNDKRVKELCYTNNYSTYLKMRAIAPFKVSLSTDKTAYSQGESVTLTGNINGIFEKQQDVEIYIIADGAKMTWLTAVDSTGHFSLAWQPYPGLSGHFTAGACFPGEDTKESMVTFDIYGLKQSVPAAITLEPSVGMPVEGTVTLVNTCMQQLTGVSVETIEQPEGISATFDISPDIMGGSTVALHYQVESNRPTQGNDWELVKIRVKTNEGVLTYITFYVYTRQPVASLWTDISQIKTTVTLGIQRNYSIKLENRGMGETGIINLLLPNWMSNASGSATLSSMVPGESRILQLLLSPSDDMTLNVPQKGTLKIDCEYGNELTVPYEVTPVSEVTGTLVVDVVDAYTFYTSEAPHVSGARVEVLTPYTGELMAEGTTGLDGLFTTTLPEGYYAINVISEKHEAYSRNLCVAPGMQTYWQAILQYNPISVNFTMTETEVADEYEIKTTIDYETNVPVPVIILDMPDRIDADQLAEGESLLFNAIITNKGLIAGKRTALLLENHPLFNFEPLVKSYDLTIAPGQSIVIPIKVTRKNVGQANSSRKIQIAGIEVKCGLRAETITYYDCGVDGQWYRCEKTLMLFMCDITDHNKYTVPEFPKDSICPPPPVVVGGGSSDPIEIIDPEKWYWHCDPCQNTKLMDLVFFGASFIPGLNVLVAAAECGGRIHEGKRDAETYLGCASVLAPFMDKIKPIKNRSLTDILNFLVQYSIPCELGLKKDMKLATRASEISYLTAFEQMLDIPISELRAYIAYLTEIFGSDVWAKELDILTQQEFLNVVMEQDGEYFNAVQLLAYKPVDISEEMLNAFVERMNNTTKLANGIRIDSDNYIHDDIIVSCLHQMAEAERNANERNYANTEEMLEKEFDMLLERLTEASNTICATVKMQITQTMTFNRPAYRGTLSVFNGHDSVAMTDARLNLVVKNEYGNIATAHEFQINAESLEGFGGEVSLTSGWTLEAQQTGKATVLFIPTKYAAPTEPVKYSFGGSLTYIDPFTGLEVTRDLFPVTLTVNPLPDLELTYLMQRDVYGDDPLTTDVVEPMEEAEFALIINNKGNGEAKNVRMVTEHPKIIDNEKGLLIDFNIKSSQVNGEPVMLSFGQSIANNFGIIPAHSQAYAQWWLESSLLGHFTSYEVETTHVTNYGNADLSLVDTVTIHEMIHGFTLNTMHPTLNVPLRGYLVNDIADAEDLPDAVYFTDALQQELYIAQNGKIDRLSENEFLLNVMPSQAGWNYGSVTDPTHGRQKLTKIVRKSDGVEIPVDNIWQTDRTLRDGINWLYENRLHFVGNIPADGETFVLTFEPKPELELAVESYNGVPEDGTVLKEQLTTVTVKFNKPIKAETFTTEDITLYCQGTAQDASQIVIEKQNEQEYKLILNDASLGDGYYVLTVQTAGIEDNEGFNGSTSKQTSWIQYVDGKVALIVNVSPAEGGTVTPESGRFMYDSDVILKATPAEGYSFSKWMIDNETVSTDAEFTYHLYRNTELTALFKESVFTGLQPLEGDALHVTITPLPLRDNMFVSGNFKEIQHVSIYDMRGIKCLGLDNIQSGQGIYVSNLKTGIYYVQIVTDRGIYRTKVIKR